MNEENLFRAPLAAAQIDFLGIDLASSRAPILPVLQLPSIGLPIVATENHALLPVPLPLTTPANLQANQQARSIVGVDVFNADPRFTDIQGQSWTIAVIDTGINPRHSFFGADVDENGVADRIIYQYDFADGDASARDVNGHGSQTTSIIASQDVTLPGVAPAVNIISLKVFNDSGESDYSYVKQALEWVNVNADRYRIASVLMALGDNQGHAATDDQYQLGQTFAELANRGIIPVAAAGNDFARLNGQFGLSSPANDSNVVAVGAVYNANLGRQEYSNNTIAFSSEIDRLTPFSQRAFRTLFAPGAAITGAGATESNLLTLQGSSQSAAYVAGAAVLAQQLAHKYLGHSLTGSEFQELALSTGVEVKDGDDEDDSVINTGVSYRRLDLLALATKIWQMRSDASQPQLSIATSQNLAWEGGPPGSFTVTRTGSLSDALSFNYRLTGTTTNVADYQFLKGTADFLAGQSTVQINVVAIDDLLVESGETVKVSLAAGNGYQLTKSYQSGLAIVDNDSILSSSLALNQSPSMILLPSISSRRESETINNLVNLLSSLIIPKALVPAVTTIISQIESIISDTSSEGELKLVLQPAETLKITISAATNHLIQEIDFATDWLPTGLVGI